MSHEEVLDPQAAGDILARDRDDAFDRPVDPPRGPETPMGRIKGFAARLLPGRWRSRRRPADLQADGKVVLNLALQGGGARGAFTWGVLDRLLENEHVFFDGVSGTSAGAMNAVLLAGGLADGGRDAARLKLSRFWRDISYAGGWSGPGFVADMVMRAMSPYQFNPLDINPLRQTLSGLVDFDLIRTHSGVRLFIAATDVHDGKSRIFGPDEVTLEAVLASASLPHIHRAVEIDGHHYWDGGYSANPSLRPLVGDCETGDTLIVQLIPTSADSVPTTNAAIRDRLNHLIFTEPLRNEVARIEMSRRGVDTGDADGKRFHRRALDHRFHLIDATPFIRDIAPGDGWKPDWPLISRLFRNGRAAAAAWLEENSGYVGTRSTTDLTALYL